MCQSFSIVAVTTPRPVGSTVPLNFTRSCLGGAKTELICARNVIERRNEESTDLLLHALLELRQDDIDVGDVLRFRELRLERPELVQRAAVISLLDVNVAGEEARFLVHLALFLHGREFPYRLQPLVIFLFHDLRERELVIRAVSHIDRNSGLSGEFFEARLALRERISRSKLLCQIESFGVVGGDFRLSSDVFLKLVVAVLAVGDGPHEFVGGEIASNGAGDRSVSGEQEEGRQRGDAELLRDLRSLAAILRVQTEEHLTLRRLLKHLGRKHFLLHLVAPTAPVGEKVDENERVVLLRLLLCRGERFEPRPRKYLLRQQHGRCSKHKSSFQRRSSVAVINCRYPKPIPIPPLRPVTNQSRHSASSPRTAAPRRRTRQRAWRPTSPPACLRDATARRRRKDAMDPRALR